jgi:hypothetical protein
MLETIHTIVGILLFPIWFIVTSFILTMAEDNGKFPIGIKMIFACLLAAMCSFLWPLLLPLALLIVIGRALSGPYEKMCDILYKLVFNKE